MEDLPVGELIIDAELSEITNRKQNETPIMSLRYLEKELIREREHHMKKPELKDVNRETV
jgi:hypothetical protein